MKTSDEKEYEHAVIAACSAFMLTFFIPSGKIDINVTRGRHIKTLEYLPNWTLKRQPGSSLRAGIVGAWGETKR